MPIGYGQCKGRKYNNIQPEYESKTNATRKRCTQCRKVLPLSLFYKDYRSDDGYGKTCKLCRASNSQKRKK